MVLPTLVLPTMFIQFITVYNIFQWSDTSEYPQTGKHLASFWAEWKAGFLANLMFSTVACNGLAYNSSIYNGVINPSSIYGAANNGAAATNI